LRLPGERFTETASFESRPRRRCPAVRLQRGPWTAARLRCRAHPRPPRGPAGAGSGHADREDRRG